MATAGPERSIPATPGINMAFMANARAIRMAPPYIVPWDVYPYGRGLWITRRMRSGNRKITPKPLSLGYRGLQPLSKYKVSNSKHI